MKLGIGFAERVTTIHGRKKNWEDRKQTSVDRVFLSYLFLLVGVGILLFQLFRLQVLQGSSFRALADQNRLRTITIYAPRGILYDRNGTALVVNIPGFREVEQNCNTIKPCSKVLTRDEVISEKVKGNQMPNLEIDSLRQYIYPEVFAHVLGYVSEVTQEELNDPDIKAQGYTNGDRIGRGGIESQYEDILKGRKGKEIIEVDASGNPIRTLGKFDPVSGPNLTLTLDLKLALAASNAMQGRTGAVVVSNPQNGEILALYSSPSFDPNLFTIGQNYKKNPAFTKASELAAGESTQSASPYTSASQILLDSKNLPLFNRSISGTYPPGSTFKIITAASALEKKVIDKDTKIDDTGILSINGFSFSNWYYSEYGKKEGEIGIVDAIKRSNDIFFYKAAEMVGLDDLRNMGLKFKLSQKLGIDLPQESPGLFPSEAWKEQNYHDKWYLGDTYHLGIGQGFLLTTPLQVNEWTSVIANGGTLFRPHLLKDKKPEILASNFLKTETIDLIRQGMSLACDPGGTGWPLFNFKVKNDHLQIDGTSFLPPSDSTAAGVVHIPIACKTGTAETDIGGGTHAWLTAYAPLVNPEIAVTVLVEKGGQGSDVAGPVARQIFEEYFKDK